MAGNLLRALAMIVPYKIHTVLIDNGTHFTDPTGDGWTAEEINTIRKDKVSCRCHSFELAERISTPSVD